MKLIKIENYQLKVEDELLLLKPFKILYDKDKSKDKAKFIEFLTIIYFLIDPRSDYSYIVNDDLRLKEILKTNGIKKDSFTKEEKECINLYKELTTTVSLELLRSTKVAIDKVKSFLESVDLTLLDDKNKPIYTIDSVTRAIKMIPSLAKEVTDAEKAVAKEIEEAGRARGNQGSKTLMDDMVLT